LKKFLPLVLSLLPLAAAPLLAQSESRSSDLLSRQVIGTDPAPGESRHDDSGMFRIDGLAFLASQQQLGPRGGDDELFSTNYLQVAMSRGFGRSAAMFRVTGTVEPATISDESVPSLFQSGPNRDGDFLIDHQPAQRYLTEAAVGFATDLGSFGALSIYAAPVGVPAFGTTPSRQRSSSASIVRTPLRESMQSFAGSASNVVTAGLTLGPVTLEASGFHYSLSGGEVMPDSGSINAKSARVRFSMTRNMFLQASIAEGDDEVDADEQTFDRRTSAGFTYARTSGNGGVAFTVSGAEEQLVDGEKLRALVGEGRFAFGANTISLRGESADTPGLFELEESPELAGQTFRIDAYTLGYTRDIFRLAGATLSLGGEMTYFHAPHSFEEFYGHKPQSSRFFVRISPTRSLLALR
jgi:hypothetical protein